MKVALLRRHRAGILACACAVLACGSASAATATGAMAVTATVVKACVITPGVLAFGSYDPTATAALQSTTTLNLVCTSGSSYDIGMDAGKGPSASTTTRQMSFGSSTLGYQIFQDAGYSKNWGNSVGVDTLHGTTGSSSLSNTINVYGQIPKNQTAAIGAYTDAVVVTVTY